MTLVLVTLITFGFGWYAPDMRLDVSADSLILESDTDLDYYRDIRSQYGADDSVVVTYAPHEGLFNRAALDRLTQLRDQLQALPRVSSVISILDAPLLMSPVVPLLELDENLRKLSSHPDTDLALAQQELTGSPLYSQRLMSMDGSITVLQIGLRSDPEYQQQSQLRDRLRSRNNREGLNSHDQQQLAALNQQLRELKKQVDAQQHADIADIRHILDGFRSDADIHLGGAPMIISDMLDFIRHDLLVFGVAVLLIFMLLLALLFRRPRWVVLPILVALASGVITAGFLGIVGWPITVVSSNFLALLLIFSLSLVIHLIVRYRELHRIHLPSSERELVRRTLRGKAAPSFFTVITTMVAFASLVVSDIRPLIDFGWIMVIALGITFILAFTLFPSALMLLKPGAPSRSGTDLTKRITLALAYLVERHGILVLAASLLLFIASGIGMSRLSVENRFIDYFHQSTEIYQGMLLIDNELGGTTPLEVIIDPPPTPAPAPPAEPAAAVTTAAAATEPHSEIGGLDDASFDDEDDFDDFDAEEDELEDSGSGITGNSYWFNTYMLKQVAAIHNYLEGLPDTGKVLSLHTTMAIVDALDPGPLDDFALALMYQQAPNAVKQALIAPYLSADGKQLRFYLRIHDANPTLERSALIAGIRNDLVNKLGLAPEQIHLTGMMVLYNNLLQSLFRSQIVTLGAVFLVILLTLAVLFRSLGIALLAIVPNLLAASMVLGMIGLLGIPLDIMTITIAAITIGIGVDNTIHYIHRFHAEWQVDCDYRLAVRRAHASIGRAMYYTSLIITIGFLVLALSQFIPTVYFGLFTAFAMVSALIANLTLLPMLLRVFKPYGRGKLPATPSTTHSSTA